MRLGTLIPDHLCRFTVRVRWDVCLAAFLGSMVTAAIGSPEGSPYYQVRLSPRICLRGSAPTPFNRHPSAGGRSLLRLHIAVPFSAGIFTGSSIRVAVRLSVRSRLTLIRRALIRNPWSFGGGESHPPYRYSFLHLLFRTLQPASSPTFPAVRNAPLPSLRIHCFGGRLMPDYYPRPAARLVSCYALLG